MAGEIPTTPTPRMALTPGRTRVGRFPTSSVTVAKILHASGHTPDEIVFRTLRTVHERCPGLSFKDFCGGVVLALTMQEAPERGHS